MNRAPDEPDDRMLASVRLHRLRQEDWQRSGAPATARFIGQIGVLGWIIVAPTLIGLFIGRWIDHQFGTGIFWSAPLLLVGVVIGCWSAWRWMHAQ